MAHSLSSKKRMRQNVKRRLRNRARRSAVKTQIRKFHDTLRSTQEAEAVGRELRLAQKKIDKLVASGTMHRNTAARRKAQLMKQANAAKAKAS